MSAKSHIVRILLGIALAVLTAHDCWGHENSMPEDSARYTFKRLLIESGVGCAINFGGVAAIKHTIHEMRPNREDNQSFPSRHATLAWSWGSKIAYRFNMYNNWWTPSMHLAASALSQQRIMARKHYAGDVIGGTVLGLGSSWFSSWVADKILGPCRLYSNRLEIKPSRGFSLMVSTHALLSMGWNSTSSERDIRTTMSGYGTSITANMPLNDNWGLIGTLGLSSYQLSKYEPHAYICPINAFDVIAGASYSNIFGPKPVECYGSISAGWRHFDADIECSSDSPIVKLLGGFNVYFFNALSIGPAVSVNSYRFTCYGNKANRLGMLELAFSLNSRIYF